MRGRIAKPSRSQACKTEPPDWPRRFAELAGATSHPSLKRLYAQGVVAGDTPLDEVQFVALDLETGGLDPRRHSIVSLGLVPFDLKRIRCRDARYWVVSPRRSLDDQSITIHNITHAQIHRAPDLEEIIDELLAALAGRVVVVHYHPIERRFLDRAFRERLGEGLVFPLVDTLEIETRFHRVRKPGLIGRLLGRQPVSVRLASSRSRYNLPLYGAHHALTDALATAELFQAQVAHHFSPDTPISELWL